MERTETVETGLAVQEFSLPDRSTVQGRLSQVRDFQQLVSSSLINGLDYGRIPGTQKDTMFKPGAEKIFKLLGLAERFEVDRELSVQDWDRPLFSFVVRCQAVYIATGEIVAEGLGNANTYEDRYRYRWLPVWEVEKMGFTQEQRHMLPSRTFTSRKGNEVTTYRLENEEPFSLVNTVLKMAKKRAMVDVALSVGRLSDIFTQDLEDRQPQPATVDARPAEPAAPAQPGTFADRGQLMAAAREEFGLGVRDVQRVLGVEHTGEITDFAAAYRTLADYHAKVVENPPPPEYAG